jgi:hypothetical protein
MSLGRLLALLVLVTALPLLLATYLSFSRLSAHERAGVESSLMVSAKILAGLVDSEIDTHYAIIKTLSQSRALERGDLGEFWQEAHRAMEVVPGAWLSVNDPQGRLLLASLIPFGSALPERTDAADMLRSVGEKSGRVSDLRQNLVARKLASYIDLPVPAEAPRYILSISLNPERFYSLIRDRFVQGELIGILDRNSRFIARIPDNEGRVGTLASEGWRAGIAKARDGFTYNRFARR